MDNYLTMKKFHYIPILCGILLFCVSCNKDEGLGGSSAIQGYVYNIVYSADNFSFVNGNIVPTCTIPAAGEKVYIVYGDDENNPVANQDVDANKNGMYHFQYLQKGNYIVYAYSEYPKGLGKEKVPVMQRVKVASETAQANPIYIYSGDGYGLSMITGKVMTQYYDKGLPIENPIVAVEHRVYLKRFGESTLIDDVRVGNEGIFIFTKVPPGKYEVYTTTEERGIQNRPFPTIPQIIEVVEAHKVYDLPTVFNIISNI